FPGLENAPPCLTNGNPDQSKCMSSEFCTVGGQCAPRSIEQRFCMATCNANGDCRDGYECRGHDLQVAHGGEPVPDPTATTNTVPSEAFCGSERICTTNADCDPTETCDPFIRVCVPRPG